MLWLRISRDYIAFLYVIMWNWILEDVTETVYAKVNVHCKGSRNTLGLNWSRMGKHCSNLRNTIQIPKVFRNIKNVCIQNFYQTIQRTRRKEEDRSKPDTLVSMFTMLFFYRKTRSTNHWTSSHCFVFKLRAKVLN